jgi:pSer/pThr/pTyr-binding forkhead associated (FHA) protein
MVSVEAAPNIEAASEDIAAVAATPVAQTPPQPPQHSQHLWDTGAEDDLADFDASWDELLADVPTPPPQTTPPPTTYPQPVEQAVDSPIDHISQPEPPPQPAPEAKPSLIQAEPLTFTLDEEASAPDEEASAPDEEASAPDEEASAPDEEASAPDEETSAPDEEASAPDEEASAPDEEASAPDEEASAPDEETSAPDEETSALDEEPSALDEEPSALDEEPSAPDAEPSAQAVSPLGTQVILMDLGLLSGDMESVAAPPPHTATQQAQPLSEQDDAAIEIEEEAPVEEALSAARAGEDASHTVQVDMERIIEAEAEAPERAEEPLPAPMLVERPAAERALEQILERIHAPEPDVIAAPRRGGLARDHNQLDAALVMFSPGGQPTVHKLRRDVTTLGRGLSCDVVLEDEAASRMHASIAYQDGRLEIIDEQSRNGFSVNGHRVKRAQLREGDHVEVGACVLRVVLGRVTPKHLEPGPAPSRPPARIGQMGREGAAGPARVVSHGGERVGRGRAGGEAGGVMVSAAARRRASSAMSGGVVVAAQQPLTAMTPSAGKVTWAGVLVGVLLCVLGLALALAVFQVFQPV